MESSDVSTLGKHLPYNVILSSSNPDAVDEYFRGAAEEMRERRSKQDGGSAREPSLWPLDKLRLELDEAWPSGAGLAREPHGRRRPFGGGLARVMVGPTRWRKGFIHVDELAPLSPQRGLFSANIYLQLPSSDLPSVATDLASDNSTKNTPNEVLQLWPLGIRSRWDYYKVYMT